MRLPLALMLATAAALPVEHSKLLTLVQDDLVGLERMNGGSGNKKSFVVRGGEVTRFNGKYEEDTSNPQLRPGSSRPYKQVNGGGKDGRIQYANGYWYLNDGYKGGPIYRCKSTSPTPPTSGWEVGTQGRPATKAPTLNEARTRPRLPARLRLTASALQVVAQPTSKLAANGFTQPASKKGGSTQLAPTKPASKGGYEPEAGDLDFLKEEDVSTSAGSGGFVVSGLGGPNKVNADITHIKDMNELNGKYVEDPTPPQLRPGDSLPYRQENGHGSMSYSAANGYWYLNEVYRGRAYFRCKSTSSTPPLEGWTNLAGQGPPPKVEAETVTEDSTSEQTVPEESTKAVDALREIQNILDRALA